MYACGKGWSYSERLAHFIMPAVVGSSSPLTSCQYRASCEAVIQSGGDSDRILSGFDSASSKAIASKVVRSNS